MPGLTHKSLSAALAVSFLFTISACSTGNDSGANIMTTPKEAASQAQTAPVPTPAASAQPSPFLTPSPTPQGANPEKTRESESLYEQGYALYNEFKYDEAIRLFDRAIETDPGNYKAYNGKGITLCFKGSYQPGMELIKKALSMNPDFPYANFNMAMAYKLQKDYDNALTWFEKAISLDPKDTWSYYGISTIYADRDNTSNALEYLRKAIELDPAVKDVAKSQAHYDGIRNNPDFIKLIRQ